MSPPPRRARARVFSLAAAAASRAAAVGPSLPRLRRGGRGVAAQRAVDLREVVVDLLARQRQLERRVVGPGASRRLERRLLRRPEVRRALLRRGGLAAVPLRELVAEDPGVMRIASGSSAVTGWDIAWRVRRGGDGVRGGS